MDPIELMRLAILKAEEGIERGQSPFGCAVAKSGSVLAVAHNTVRETPDVTAHAEVNALREACRATGEIAFDGAIVATTCEPCPMCMAALHWARVDTVYCGATIADAAAAGFNELHLSAHDLLRYGKSSVQLVSGFLQEECQALFTRWRDLGVGSAY